MLYNNGSTINYDKIENYTLAAKEFSEGNENLEKILLYCFDNGIKTVGCCSGHKERFESPYISFEYNDYNKKFIYHLISLFKDLDISLSYAKSSCGHIFSLISTKDDLDLFDIINSSLESTNKLNTLDEEFKEYIDMVESAYDGSILSDQYYMLGYAKFGDEYSYSFSLYTLESYKIFEEVGLKKIQAPFARYYINSTNKLYLSDKLKMIKQKLENITNNKVR